MAGIDTAEDRVEDRISDYDVEEGKEEDGAIEQHQETEQQVKNDKVETEQKSKPLPWWMQPLPVPDLGPLRYAGPLDIGRLGIVQYARFANTREYKYMYPDHAEYLMSAINWECRRAVQAIDASRDRKSTRVCLVIEAEYENDEKERSGIIEPGSEMVSESGTQNGKVIVGFAVWTIPESLMFRRTMRCTSEDECPEIPKDLTRDENNDRVMSLREVTHELEEKHRDGSEIVLDRLVVHPAYHRAGYGESLVQWGIRFAKMTGASIFVNAAADGVPLYEHAGFQKLDEHKLEGDEAAPEGTSGWIMKYSAAE